MPSEKFQGFSTISFLTPANMVRISVRSLSATLNLSKVALRCFSATCQSDSVIPNVKAESTQR